MIYPTRAELLQPSHGGRSPAGRLLSRFSVDRSGCWHWTRARTGSGYGHFSIRGRYYQAHRLMHILLVGSVPDGYELDHLCRNRGCVNPAHMEVVTHAVNSQRGERARLTRDQVAAIRKDHADGAGVRALARRFRVDPANVSRIVNGIIWRDEPAA